MSSQKRKYKKRKKDHLVLDLLVIVALVLVVFEGNLILTMVRHRSSSTATVTAANSTSANTNGTISDKDSDSNNSQTASSAAVSKPVTATSSSSLEATLAGLSQKVGSSSPSAASSSEEPQQASLPTVSKPGSSAIVPKMSPSVDDSYFSDAAFIGDSRMEGFRMASGITQGRFFTSIGMSLQSMRSESVIATPEGNITVAAALSGGKYNKVYIMLGTNDLGEFDWDSFKEGFISTLARFQEIQPDAIFYICSVIYVEEDKVPDTTYINNANVDKINSILLDICEEKGYHYLDLNEFLTSGWGSLTYGASSDGVHLYETYCKQMLDYLKSHYIEVAPKETEKTEKKADSDNEIESESEEGVSNKA